MKNCDKIELNQYEFDVFISYSHSCDRNKLDILVESLRSKGLVVCIDTQKFVVGNLIFSEIVTNLERAKVVLCLIDKDYIKKEWCLGELFIGMAFNSFKPVLLEDISFKKLPFNLDSRLFSKFSDLIQDTTTLEKFLTDIANQCDKTILRSTFDEAELVINGASIRSVATLRSDFLRKRALLCMNSIEEACAFFSNHDDAEVKRAFAQYSHHDHIITGLMKLHRSAIQKKATREQWRHLATLSEPFSDNVFRACKQNYAPAKDVDLLRSVPVLRASKYRRKKAKIPHKWKQIISGIKIADKNYKLPDRYKFSINFSTRWSELRSKFELRKILQSIQLQAKQNAKFDAPVLKVTPPTQSMTLGESLSARLSSFSNKLEFSFHNIMEPLALIFAILVSSSFVPRPINPVVTEDTAAVAAIIDEEQITPSRELYLPAYCNTFEDCFFEHGHTLSDIAKECFGERNQWPEVWRVNPNIRNPDLIYAGNSFTIPQNCIPPNPTKQ